MQRIVGLFVGSAYGAGQFYSRAVTEGRHLTTKLSDRTETRTLRAHVGFDSRAQRKREFAADMNLPAHVLRMAAGGAVTAYEDITGEAWKPYQRSVKQPTNSVDQKPVTVKMAAFEQDERGASVPLYSSVCNTLRHCREKGKRAGGKPRPIKKGHGPI